MNKTLQAQFLEKLIQKFSKKTEAVEAISKLLSVGKDAVYRRLRGDSVLTPEEMKILAKKFGISIDRIIFNQTDKVFFTYNSFSNPVKNFDDYLIGLNRNLDVSLNLPNSNILYATAEIPMFYYGLFPEMMCFKLYVWGRTVWNLEYLQDKPFSFNLFPPKTMELITENVTKYLRMPSTELWCINIFDNSLNQIEFVLTNGNFEKEEDSIMLCDSLIKLSRHMCKMAESGKKFGVNSNPETSTVPYELYHNELVFTNNTILLSSDLVKAVYSTFDSPNFLISDERRIYEHAENWFHNIKNKSEYLTEVSEKHRNRFFNRLEKKVKRTRSRLENLIEQI